MHQCAGCSRFFRLKLPGAQCQRCLESVAKPRNEWTVCSGCGNIYPFLEKETECGPCLIAQSSESKVMPPPKTIPDIKNAARYAMSHPANPRTHSSKENPHRGQYFNPHSTLGKDLAVSKSTWEKHAQSASEIIMAISSSHSRAHVRQSGFPPSAKVPLAPPKVKGQFRGTPKPEIGGNLQPLGVIISKIEHRGRQGVKPFKDSNHEPVIARYAQATPWSTAVEHIRKNLDKVYSDCISYRIRHSTQFSLRYNTTGNSRVFLHEDHTKDTIAYLWSNSISMPGNLVSAKSEKSLILDLVAVVDYPPSNRVEDGNYGEDTSLASSFLEPPPSRISKRKSDEHLSIASGSFEPPTKRTSLFVPSETQYYSKIALSLTPQKTTQYLVAKFDLAYENDQHKWIESPNRLELHVERNYFSAGSTKRVYKRFYNIGKGAQEDDIPYDENYRHLQEELICQFVVNICTEKFQNLCEKNDIAAFDVEVEKGYILRVCEGPETGLAWIVAPLLDHTKMRKFSGTERAGSSKDLPGKTCDAIAHFSLSDSRNMLVFVDVQGIISASEKSQKVVLFDLMMHTDIQWCGLGDYGVPGIKTFKPQHTCNNICEAIGLPKPAHNYGINESEVAITEDDAEKSISPCTPLHSELVLIRKAAEEKAKKEAESKEQSLKAACTRSGKDYHN